MRWVNLLHLNRLIFIYCLLTDINDCVNHTCRNGGSCVDGVNSYTCNCLAGFTGDHCDTGKSLSLLLNSE